MVNACAANQMVGGSSPRRDTLEGRTGKSATENALKPSSTMTHVGLP